MGLVWRDVKRGGEQPSTCVVGTAVRCGVLTMIGIVFTASVALSEVITIVGNGPELRVIEQLTRFFEKKIPVSVAIDHRRTPDRGPDQIRYGGFFISATARW